jgi:hypothetical protein
MSSRLLFCKLGRRPFHTVPPIRNRPTSFTNILASDIPPPVQVDSLTPEGIRLADGLVIPSACIFLEGKVFLWDVPSSLWTGWTKDHFEILEIVSPRPGERCSSRIQRLALIFLVRDIIVRHWKEGLTPTTIHI